MMNPKTKIEIILIDADISLDMEWFFISLPQVGDYIDITSLCINTLENRCANAPIPQCINDEGFINLLEFIQYHLWIIESRSWYNGGLRIICRREDYLELNDAQNNPINK